MVTNKQLLIAALEARGSRHLPTRTKRFAVYTHWLDVPARLFVGGKGALRTERTASTSYSLTDTPTYAQLLAEGRAILERRS